MFGPVGATEKSAFAAGFLLLGSALGCPPAAAPWFFVSRPVCGEQPGLGGGRGDGG